MKLEEKDTCWNWDYVTRTCTLFTTEENVYRKVLERIGDRAPGVRAKVTLETFEIENIPFSLVGSPERLIKREVSAEQRERLAERAKTNFHGEK